MSDERPRLLRDQFDEEMMRRRRRADDGETADTADGEPTVDQSGEGAGPLGDGATDSIDSGPAIDDDITGATHADASDVQDAVIDVVHSVGELGVTLVNEAAELPAEGYQMLLDGASEAMDVAQRASQLAAQAVQTVEVIAGGDNPWAGGGSSSGDGGDSGDSGDDDDSGDDGEEVSGGDIISELGGELQMSTAPGVTIDPIVLADAPPPGPVVDDVAAVDDAWSDDLIDG